MHPTSRRILRVGLATGALLACAASPASASYAGHVLETPGLEGYWRLGETSGSTAYDLRGWRDGTYGTQVYLGRPGALAGDGDTAAEFQGGVVDEIWESSLLTPLARVYSEPLRPFSVEAWVKPGLLDTNTRRIFSAEGPTGGFLLGARADGLAFSRHVRAGALGETAARAHTLLTPLAAGAWSHVVATYDGAAMRLYVNGSAVGERPSDIPLASTAPLRIGSMPGRWREWDGLIDEAAEYRRALSPAEVADHYAAGTTPVPPPPAPPAEDDDDAGDDDDGGKDGHDGGKDGHDGGKDGHDGGKVGRGHDGKVGHGHDGKDGLATR